MLAVAGKGGVIGGLGQRRRTFRLFADRGQFRLRVAQLVQHIEIAGDQPWQVALEGVQDGLRLVVLTAAQQQVGAQQAGLQLVGGIVQVQRQRLAYLGAAGGVVAQRGIGACEGAAQLRFGIRMRGQRAGVKAVRAIVQQLAHADVLAPAVFRVDAGEDAGQVVADRIRARGLQGGAMRLPQRRAAAGQDRQQRQRAAGHRPAMALHEAPRAVAQRGLARGHRQAVQPCSKIGAERGGAGVAGFRLALQGLAEDHVEVAAQQPHELQRTAAMPARGIIGQLGGTRRGAGDGLFQQLQLLPQRRLRGDSVRVHAGQQAVQQHAEPVDVGGGADAFAQQLLRCGELGREHALGGAGQGGLVFAQGRCRSPSAAHCRWHRSAGCRA